MKYFLTGATGFIGGRLAFALIAAGHRVVAVVRDPGKATSLAEAGVEIRAGDVTDKESMRASMTGVDGVFHVAGWYKLGERDTSPGRRVNVDGTRNVLELMQELAIPKGVYTSTLAIFSDTRGRIVDESYRFSGRHLTAYDRTKAQAHYDVAEPMIRAGSPLVVVLPGVVYGPGDTSPIRDTLVHYLQRRLPAIPARTTYCWGYVDDMVQGHIEAMERGVPGQSYIISGPAHTLAEALQIAESITGIPAPRIRIPPLMMRATAGAIASLERVLPVPPTYRSEVLRSSAGVTYVGSNEKARRELGLTARPLADGFRDTLPPLMTELGIRPV